MQKRLLLATAGASIVVTVTGCSGSGSGSGSSSPQPPLQSRPASSPSAPVAPTSSPPPAAASDGAVSVRSATPLPRSAYDVVGTFRRLGEGTWASVVAVKADGTVLRHVTEAPRNPQDLAPKPGWWELVAPSGKTERIEPELPGDEAPGFPVFAGDHLVWQQTDTDNLTDLPWTLYDYNRRTQVTRELAASPRMTDGSPALSTPGWTDLESEDGRVFWAQTSGDRAAARVDVWGCEIEDCHPRRYLRSAAYPAIADGVLYALRSPLFDGRRSELPRTSFRVVALDLAGSSVTTIATLPRGISGGGLEASGGRVLWIENDRLDRLMVRDLRTGTTSVFRGLRGEGFGYPVLTDRYAAWAEGSGGSRRNIAGYLYDFRNRRLHTLGDTSGLYALEGAGDVLKWNESRGATDLGFNADIVAVVARLR